MNVPTTSDPSRPTATALKTLQHSSQSCNAWQMLQQPSTKSQSDGWQPNSWHPQASRQSSVGDDQAAEEIMDQVESQQATHVPSARSTFANPGKNSLLKGLPTPCPRLKILSLARPQLAQPPEFCTSEAFYYMLCQFTGCTARSEKCFTLLTLCTPFKTMQGPCTPCLQLPDEQIQRERTVPNECAGIGEIRREQADGQQAYLECLITEWIKLQCCLVPKASPHVILHGCIHPAPQQAQCCLVASLLAWQRCSV